MLPLLHHEPDPAPAGLRERKKHQARTTIGDAALELFATRGFDATTVADVAERAGVSTATVARYFPTKEALLFPDRDLNTAAVRAAIEGRPARESPFAAVVAGLTAASPPGTTEGAEHDRRDAGDLRHLDADGRHRLLLSRQAIARSAALRGRATALLGAWRDTLAEAAEARGAAPDEARVLATVVVAVLDDTAEQWALTGGRTDLEGAVADAFSALSRSQRRTP